MDLPLLSALFLLFVLTLYVVLDGFDLGVGVLLFAQRDQRVRDRMVDAIAPTWDGNETWLIMAGITLLAGFPLAYSVLLPAFYLPLVAMLLSLGLRGVSFEFRHHSAHARRRWDAVFGGGSLVAALAQGAIVGGLIQGVRIERETFAGGPTDIFTPFCVLTSVTVLAGYATLGAGWLRLKGQGETRSFAGARLRWLALAFLGLTILTSMAAVDVQPELALTWGSPSRGLVAACASLRELRGADRMGCASRRRGGWCRVRARHGDDSVRHGEPGARLLSERHPLQDQFVAGGVRHREPRLSPHRSRPGDAGRARLQRLRLLGVSWQDARGRLGTVTAPRRPRQWLWFLVLYAASVGTATLMAYGVRVLLRTLW